MEFSTLEIIRTGLLQGIPLALLVAVADIIRRYSTRRSQKKYIRTIISAYVEQIRDAKEVPHPDPRSKTKIMATADQVRKVVYDSMYKEVDKFLSHKTTQLDYDDEKKIRDAFGVINFMDENQRIASLQIYEKTLFKGLMEVKWLKL